MFDVFTKLKCDTIIIEIITWQFKIGHVVDI